MKTKMDEFENFLFNADNDTLLIESDEIYNKLRKRLKGKVADLDKLIAIERTLTLKEEQ